MTLAELKPDIALKALFKDMNVQTGAYEYATKENVYTQDELPDKDLGETFIVIGLNGLIETVTHPIGMFRGNLAVTINNKCGDNGEVNTTIMPKFISEVESRCFYKASQGFYFEPATYAVIMPTTTDKATGYATTILNIKWHTIHNDANSLNL